MSGGSLSLSGSSCSEIRGGRALPAPSLFRPPSPALLATLWAVSRVKSGVNVGIPNSAGVSVPSKGVNE